MSLAAETRADRAGLGIVLMLSAWALFAGVDTAAKWLALLGIPALQLAFMRYAVAFALSAAIGLRQGVVFEWGAPRVMALVLLRASLLMMATIFNFIALGYLPLSVTSSIMSSSPILLTALAFPILGERVGPWRWVAVFLGFAGVLIVIRPFGDGFHWAALLMVANAGFVALFALLTRHLSGQIATQTMQIYTGAVGTIFLLIPGLMVWSSPEILRDWLLLFALGTLAWAGHEIFSRAHAFAEASVLVPFNYVFIIYLTLAGYLVFGDIPDFWGFLGAAIIIASGQIIWWREHR